LEKWCKNDKTLDSLNQVIRIDADTMMLNMFQTSFNSKKSWNDLRKLIFNEILSGNAVVINRVSGEKVNEIEKIKYNYINGPRWGAGGVVLVSSDSTIINISYWKM